jgi:hypothetical protein
MCSGVCVQGPSTAEHRRTTTDPGSSGRDPPLTVCRFDRLERSVALGEQAGCGMTMLVSFPGLHRKRHPVSSLLLEGCRHAERSPLTERTPWGLRHDFRARLHGQEVTAGTRLPLLPAALAASVMAPLFARRLKNQRHRWTSATAAPKTLARGRGCGAEAPLLFQLGNISGWRLQLSHQPHDPALTADGARASRDRKDPQEGGQLGHCDPEIKALVRALSRARLAWSCHPREGTPDSSLSTPATQMRCSLDNSCACSQSN